MGLLTTSVGRRMLGGAMGMLLADSLLPILALVTTGFLTRQLGPRGYGMLALTLSAVTFGENALNAFFSRATIKLIGEASDWRPLGSHIIRRALATGTAVMVGLWLLALPISVLLGEPTLARYLRLGAVDIPILCAALAYRSVLVGTARFHAAAVGRAGRWLTRFCLVALLVWAGFAISGALVGVIAASLVELIVCRIYVGPGMLRRGTPVTAPIRQYGLLLFASSVSLSLLGAMDLFMLKALGGSAAQAGLYGAAQSLALLPALFSWTFASPLLATLSRLMADSSFETGRVLACDATRMTLWLLPVAAIVAGSSPEVVRAIFGDAFAPAWPLLSVLIAGGVVNVVLVVALTITTAMGYPVRTVLLSVPLAPLAFVGHQFAIPRWGSGGAAVVTCVVTCVGAGAALVAIHRWWRMSPPAATWLRSGMVALAAGAVATIWPMPGIMVFVKLAVLGAAAVLSLWATGEFRPGELAEVRSLFRRKAQPDRVV